MSKPFPDYVIFMDRRKRVAKRIDIKNTTCETVYLDDPGQLGRMDKCSTVIDVYDERLSTEEGRRRMAEFNQTGYVDVKPIDRNLYTASMVLASGKINVYEGQCIGIVQNFVITVLLKKYKYFELIRRIPIYSPEKMKPFNIGHIIYIGEEFYEPLALSNNVKTYTLTPPPADDNLLTFFCQNYFHKTIFNKYRVLDSVSVVFHTDEEDFYGDKVTPPYKLIFDMDVRNMFELKIYVSMTNAHEPTTAFYQIETFDLRSRNLSHFPLVLDVQSAYSCKISEVDLKTKKRCTYTQVVLFVELESGGGFERAIFNAVDIVNSFVYEKIETMDAGLESIPVPENTAIVLATLPKSLQKRRQFEKIAANNKFGKTEFVEKEAINCKRLLLSIEYLLKEPKELIFMFFFKRNLSGVKKKSTYPRIYVMHCEPNNYDYINSAEKKLEDMKKQYKPVKRCFVIYEDTKPNLNNVNGLQYVYQRKSSDDAFRKYLFTLVDDAYSW